GLEDKDEIFWDKPTISVPVGMCWSPEGLYVSSHGKVSLLSDTNADGKADEEKIIADGWPATDVGSGGVDATSVTRDAEGNIYFGLLVADYSNAYRIKDGVSRYDINSTRGTIQKWSPKTKKLETIATGIRVPYNLAFNKANDLFNTDQEGETWMPNGNPLDELNYILAGKNYGFPPRHEKWLPNLVSEPPVVGFGPQHQSTCGLDFNEPKSKSDINPARGLFGPKWWEGNAFVAGESRGKIWRVKLVKTANGYIGKEFLFARLSMLTMDVQISPKGDLYVCCHSGKPDWGTGPRGEGKIFKISYADTNAPQPVAVWAAGPTEVRVAFDKEVEPSITNQFAGKEIEFGEFVTAAERYEVVKPSYQSVKIQEQTPRGKLKIFSARLEKDQQTLVLSTAVHPLAVRYALTIPGVKAKGAPGSGATVDLDYDVSGTLLLPQKDLDQTKTGGAFRDGSGFQLVKNFHPDWVPSHQPFSILPGEKPELAGGDFERGKNLFFGDKLKCATCHRIRDEGKTIGPDLSNLASRDAGSILRDIKEPNVTINPDYVAFNVSLKNGEDVSGFIRAQQENSLTIFGLDEKETIIARSDVKSIQPSAVSLMPSGLLDGLKENEVRDLLTFLASEPPRRKSEETQRLFSAPLDKSLPQRALKIVWVASKQDHGAGQHDYPTAQKTWITLLNKASGVAATNAWEWPSNEQFADANVLVFYFWNHNWSEERLRQLDEFIERGGGVVVIHSASISDTDPERLALSIGLASQSKRTKYLHAPVDLKLAGTNEITQNFPKQIHFLDEPYWPLIGDTNKVSVLATVKMDGKDHAQVWTFEKGKGRVFGCILGHYTWTHADPLYRALILRGIAWSAREGNSRLTISE
ncbi:MAG: ThuA domain-containing protein, partial [Verrucomicrobiota bacterium]